MEVQYPTFSGAAEVVIQVLDNLVTYEDTIEETGKVLDISGELCLVKEKMHKPGQGTLLRQ